MELMYNKVLVVSSSSKFLFFKQIYDPLTSKTYWKIFETIN